MKEIKENSLKKLDIQKVEELIGEALTLELNKNIVCTIEKVTYGRNAEDKTTMKIELFEA
jgi:hypothetical protein